MAKKIPRVRPVRATSSRGDISLSEARQRLDELIGKAKDAFYKPIAVAETLFRSRSGEIDLSRKNDYRRPSDRWSKAIARRLRGAATTSNGKYWDHMFDDDKMSPPVMEALGRINQHRNSEGVVETYIYAHLSDKLLGIRSIINWLSRQDARSFRLEDLIAKFVDDQRFRNSADKLYEVAVYALFDAVTQRLNAKVTLSIDSESNIFSKFDDFATMVLGVNSSTPACSQPAKLFRVGRANASDGGLDMWGNFGPAVQVKHISLSTDGCEEICEKIYADKIIVVCKDAAAEVVGAVLSQVGFGEKVRGIVSESLLCDWYAKACNIDGDVDMGDELLRQLVDELSIEFSTSQEDAEDNMAEFARSRGYSFDDLPEGWNKLWCRMDD